MKRAVALAIALGGFVFGAGIVACGEPASRPPPRSARLPPCPPPPEPALQSIVVGTIGKLHMVESRYPLSRLGDVLVAFKPDLVLVAVRVDAFRESRFEDASFEMTYVSHLARQHGVFVEPIDWFREQDLGAPPAAVDPWDAEEIVRREAALLMQPRLFTFEQANSAELEQRVFLATNADVRHRTGNPHASRRHAWMQNLVADAVQRHGTPRRVLAYVDVFDRPPVDFFLRGAGYAARDATAMIAQAKDEMVSDVPSEVLGDYRAQLHRARERVGKATGPEKAFWQERARTLDLVVSRKATCCVTQAALAPEP